jgi:hypothetical protein
MRRSVATRGILAVVFICTFTSPSLFPALAQPPSGPRVALFDGVSLKGWNGNPKFWSVWNGAIHGVTDQTRGELLLTDGDYDNFRLIVKSRLVSQTNHLGVCFWGERLADWRYGNCILVIPPHGGMWDYHPGKGSPKRENIPHQKASPHTWHETEILAHMPSGTVRMAVNGVEIVRYTDEDHKRLRKGPIGLQIHSGASIVEYKDIEVEVNPTLDRLITVRTPPAP